MEEPGYTHPSGTTVSVDLGSGFEQRWKGAGLRQRRELLAELQSIYRSLEEHELTVLTPISSRPPLVHLATLLPELARHSQPHHPEAEIDDMPVIDLTPEPGPPSASHADPAALALLGRLLRGQVVPDTKLKEVMQTPPPPEPDILGESVEQELRARLHEVIDTMVEEHVVGLKAELRFRLRSELDQLLRARVRRA